MTFRKAKGIDGAEREWTPGENYQMFARGWYDGAGSKPVRPDHEGHPEYEAGFTDGVQAKYEALQRYCKRTGYAPEILRAT